LTTVGDSRGITLPKSWLESAEEEAGKRIVAIALEVNHVITIAPVFERKQQEEAT
jgi:antitoxin component of MazEF toxin-antitoxin module